MNLHREILEIEEKDQEVDPEREKNKKEVEKLIKQLEASSKKPKKKKSYEMDLGEADFVLRDIKEEELIKFVETKNEISSDEFERLQKVLQSMGGKIVAGGKSVKDSMVVQFPASKEKEAREIKKGLERKSRRISIAFRKEKGKVFLTMRGDK